MPKIIAKIISICLFLTAIFGILMLVLFNVKNNAAFFEASAYQIASLLIAIIVAYYLAQKKIDDRRRKDNTIKLLIKLQECFKKHCATSLENKDETILNKREIENIIYLLSKVKSVLGVRKEVDYLSQRFSEYETAIEQCMVLENATPESKLNMDRIVGLAAGKCDEMILNLF